MVEGIAMKGEILACRLEIMDVSRSITKCLSGTYALQGHSMYVHIQNRPSRVC